MSAPAPRIAVLLPCHNEAVTIARVVTEFAAELPSARIYVYDNCSTDDTSRIAAEAGAKVRSEPWPGKGNVVRRMFADIDADVYVIADGDGTYDASAAPQMVEQLLSEHLDMVVGVRDNIYREAHRRGHGLGNRMFNAVYARLFGRLFTDIFSGYRVFSKRFVKSFPAVSSGFEIETEMSVHASLLRMPVAEVPTRYCAREEGSTSKLKTFRDALRIFRMLVVLYKEFQPAKLFGMIALVLAVVAFVLGLPLLETYLDTGTVPRIPTAIIIIGIALMSAGSLMTGVLLDGIAGGRLEQKRLLYLSVGRSGLPE